MLTSNEKAVSTLTLIILLLCSAIFGALISYLLVMSSYYNMPENTTLLIVEDAVFPVSNATYFSVTILNPSNSAVDVDITAIRLIVEGKNEVYNVTTVEPSFPFLLARGTRQIFKCRENWSEFAGETVRIEPVAGDASTVSSSYVTPKVKLTITPIFEPSESVEYFNLTAKNSEESVVNLTISEIFVFGMSITENVTPSLPLPYPLSPNQMQIFRCNWSWRDMGGSNVTITVKTLEGYESTYTTHELLGAIIYTQEIQFDYENVTYFDVIFASSEDSTIMATMSQINLTLQDGAIVPVDATSPPLGYPIISSISPNQTRTFKCFWNWIGYRDKNITVNAYTKEGFTVINKTTETPPEIVWNITKVDFSLNDLEHFSVDVRNTLCSLQDIMVTKIGINDEELNFSTLISVGNEVKIDCTFNWTDLRGQNVIITVHAGNTSRSQVLTLPSVSLKIINVGFRTEEDGKSYNVTVENDAKSLLNVTATRIVVSFQGQAIYQIQGIERSVEVGRNVTLTFSWDWTLYASEVVTITVYTTEGFEAVITCKIEE